MNLRMNLRMNLPAYLPAYLPVNVAMTGLAGDDSIVHASLWMILILAVGAALLMVTFVLVTWCVRWCSRPAGQRVHSRSNIWPQM